MFGFGYVRIHLGDYFLESIQVLFCFWVGFLVRGTKLEQSGHFRGPTPRRRKPLAAAKVQAMAWHVHDAVWPSGGLVKPRVRYGVVKLCHSEGLHHSVAVLRCGIATVHSMEMFVFCLVLLFRYCKDLSIGLMRTL